MDVSKYFVNLSVLQSAVREKKKSYNFRTRVVVKIGFPVSHNGFDHLLRYKGACSL